LTVTVLEFVISDFLSNKALLLPDLYKKFEDLVDKTALIKSLKEPEDKIGEPSPIRGNTFSHLSLEDFKETGDETFEWLYKKSLITNSKTVTVKIVRVYIAIFHLSKL
jgi:hypothetical protein